MFLKMFFRVGTALPLLVGSVAMIGSGVMVELVSPTTPAIAQTTFNTNLLLQLTNQEMYSVLVARAEANAEVRVQELFDKDLLRTEVRLTVLGQNGAAIAPVLKLRVSRQDWTAYPDPEIWSVYYPESAILLNIVEAPTPEPNLGTEAETNTEEVIPIIDNTEPLTEPSIIPAGETPLSNESTTEPAESDPLMEADDEAAESSSSGDNTMESENTDSEVEPAADEDEDENMDTDAMMDSDEADTDSDTMMDTDEEMESSGSNTTRRRLRYQPADE